MADKPHETLLDRDSPPKLMEEHYGPQLELLTSMTNYASNLIPRAFSSSKKELRDVIVCFSLLKQVASMLDAMDVLARAGAIYAAMVPARVAFEASLYIEWMLVSDGEIKAVHYVVGNVRAKRLWGKRVARGAPEADAFLKDMGKIGEDILSKRPELEDLARKHTSEAAAILAQSKFSSVNAAFDQWMQDKSKNGKRTVHEPEWYKVLGKQTVRSIAKELGRLPEYIVYYGKGSQIAHSASYEDQINFKAGGAVAHPIRSLADTHTFFNFSCANAMHIFIRVLQFYRNGELPVYGSMYVNEWRNAFTKIPTLKIESKSKPRV